MEMVERITSILHCIIQSYRIIQWNIRYLSSRDSIWLRYAGHDVTSSLTVPYFLPFFPPPRKRKFSRHSGGGRGGRGGVQNDTRDTHARKYGGYYLRGTRSLGEFDFLNFRRFIVASVALLLLGLVMEMV